MESSAIRVKHKQGQQLLTTEKMTLTQQIVDVMEQGYHSINAIAEKLDINRTTVKRYKPFADKWYHNTVKLDRTAIRNLEIQRTYRILERLTQELDGCSSIKEKTAVYNQIAKFSQHLALITGLNIENKVHFNDPKKLVITRAHPDAVKAVMVEVDSYNNPV